MLILIMLLSQKLIETKTSFKYLIGYLDKTMRPLILIMFKMIGYVKRFKFKHGDKDKTIN